MPSEENERYDLDSIPLLDYLKKEIPVEELRDYASPKRINSIDLVKGLAIILIMLAHTGGSWLDSQWIFVYGIAFSLLDILGPSLFVFLSALSVVFSIRKKAGKINPKVLRNSIITRGLVICVIGVVFNLISIELTIENYTFPLTIWGWNILMFIGFSQIASFYALKLSKTSRFLIGFILIFTSDAVREYLFFGMQAGDPILTVLHYIIVSPSPMTPLLPWLSICFISTIYGEYLYDAMIGGSKTDYTVLFRKFLFSGIAFICIGIFLGRLSYVPGDTFIPATYNSIGTLPLSEYPHMVLLDAANQQYIIPGIRYAGMWEFLIRGRAPNMIYNLGAALMIIAVAFYIIDMKLKHNAFVSMLLYYGKISLSLFLVHYIYITLYFHFFTIVLFPFVWLGYVGLLGFLMYVWMEFFNGVGSPEWIMVQIGRIGQKTTESVKKEIQVIEEEIKDTIHKLKPDAE
jgi:hypothetical protein